MTVSAIKACIFDLDGVLTDTAAYHFLAWQRLAARLGIEFTLKHNEQLKGVGRMESLTYIVHMGEKRYSQQELEMYAHQKNEDYKQLIKDISPSDLLPGVPEAFEWLKNAGWKIGLASASRNARQVIAGLGIEDRFDYVADSAQIPNGKPAPDIFLDVAHAFGLTSAECIGVEDAAAGVTAIKAAGMTAIGIGDAVELVEADIILPDLEGISAVFESLTVRRVKAGVGCF